MAAQMAQLPGQFLVEFDREEDGRFIAEVASLPGVMAYGATRELALAAVQALAFRVLAEQIEHGEHPSFVNVAFVAAA